MNTKGKFHTNAKPKTGDVPAFRFPEWEPSDGTIYAPKPLPELPKNLPAPEEHFGLDLRSGCLPVGWIKELVRFKELFALNLSYLPIGYEREYRHRRFGSRRTGEAIRAPCAAVRSL